MPSDLQSCNTMSVDCFKVPGLMQVVMEAIEKFVEECIINL